MGETDHHSDQASEASAAAQSSVVSGSLVCAECGQPLAGLASDGDCPACGLLIAESIARGIQPDRLVVREVLCVRCGYDLRGLGEDGACPECNAPVELSLRGNMLRYASPEYVAKVHLGVVIVQAVIIANIVLGVFALFGGVFIAAMPFSTSSSLGALVIGMAGLIGLVGTAVWSVGWWMFTTKDPAYSDTDDPSLARWASRATLIASFALTFGLLGMQVIFLGSAIGTMGTGGMAGGQAVGTLVGVLMMLLQVAGLLVYAAQFVFSMMYLKWMASRIPDEGQVKWAKILTWLTPVTATFGIVLCGLGPLIAIVLYWNALDRFRKSLRVIRQDVAMRGNQ